MKGLLVKDFKLMKEQKEFLLVFVILYILLSAASGESIFSVGFLGFVGSLFTLSTASYDEYDNGYAFLFCLPVSRKAYVLEKYCFGFIIIGVLWVFETAFALFISALNNSASPAELLTAAFLVLPVIISLFSFMLPFQLKFGGEKGKMAIMAIIVLLTVLAVSFVKIAYSLDIDLDAVLNNLSAVKVSTSAAAGIIAAVIITLISVKISISIMNNKEF